MASDRDRPLYGPQEEIDTFRRSRLTRIGQFAALLAADDGPFTINLEGRDNVYVQARRETDGWLLESVSNAYLPAHQQLSAEAECILVELGWQAPTPRMPNFFRFYEDPVDLCAVASDILTTFTSAYGATPHGPFSAS